MTRILVVDDELVIFRALKVRLSEFEILHANCQQQALDVLGQEAFDLVLLDLRLPVQSGDMAQNIQVGFDILRWIRTRRISRRGLSEDLPVIVMTAHGDEDVSTSAFTEYGANDYIKKPFKEDLEAKIEAVLVGRQAVVPRASVLPKVQVALDDQNKRALTNGVLWEKSAYYDLLRALADQFLKDRAALKLPKNHQACTAADLAEHWGVTENTVHRRVMRFRKEISERLGHGDLIESARGRGGYRLNPFSVELVSWEEVAEDLGA